MKSLLGLKRQAGKAATARGHKLGHWEKLGEGSACASCKECGREVVARTAPALNEIDIGGEAVAVGCGDMDARRRLYIFQFAGGYSCLGFDVADRGLKAVRTWLGLPPTLARPGTGEHLARYNEAMKLGALRHDRTGERCPAELVPALVGLEGRRVEVVDCHGETRRFQVGRSTGWLPIHLEIHNARCYGGGGVYGTPFKSVRIIRQGR